MKIGDGHLAFADAHGSGIVRVAGGGEPDGIARAEIGGLQRLAGVVEVLRIRVHGDEQSNFCGSLEQNLGFLLVNGSDDKEGFARGCFLVLGGSAGPCRRRSRGSSKRRVEVGLAPGRPWCAGVLPS